MELEKRRKTEARYFTIVQTEQAWSISGLLYDQESCECSVETQQGVSSTPSF